MSSLYPFDERNTHFAVRVRNNPGKLESTRLSSPKSSNKKLFSDNDNYSCIANPKNNSIYLSESEFSGKLLNGQNFMKEDINNKFLSVDNSEVYSFDRVYSEVAKQKEFYNENARSLVNYLLSGVNSLVIAYGPQGGGKSYTLRGNENNEIGLIPRFARDLFGSLDGTQLQVHLSVVQIYKEWVFDLLRGDLDINSAENFDSVNISEVRCTSFEDFIRILGEAINKREVNSNMTSSLKKKFHLVVRLKVYNLETGKKQLHGITDFLETAESSFLNNRKNFEPSELEWLNRSFNSLFDLLLKSASKGTKNVNAEKNAFNDFLYQNLQTKGKLLFISNLTPSLRDKLKNREALRFMSDLRSLILSKGEKKLLKTPTVRLSSEPHSRKSTEPNIQLQPRLQPKLQPERQQDEIDTTASVESQLKILKAKLADINSVHENGEDLEDWVNLREFEILKLENELNVLTPNYENLTFKLREIHQLKTELKTIRDKFYKARSPSRTSSITRSNTPVLNRSIQENVRQSGSNVYQSSESIGNLAHSRSVSSISTSSNLAQKVALKRIARNSDTIKTFAKHETPKFEKDTLGKSNSSLSTLLKPKLDLNIGRDTVARASSPKRVTFKDSRHESMSFENKSYNRSDKSLGKSRSLTSKDYRNLNKSEPSPQKNADFEDAIKESERLKNLKTRNFDLLDDDEEFVVSGKVDDCKRDKLAKQYKALYYKSRELKELLNEFADNNNQLKLSLNEIDTEKRQILLENEKLREEISEIDENFSRKEREFLEIQRDLEAKLAEVDDNNYQLNREVEEAKRANDMLSARIAPYSNRDGTARSERGLTALEELERTVSYKEKLIKELEEFRAKDAFTINELRADVDMMKKKYNIAQDEIKDLQKEVNQSNARYESDSEIVQALKDQISELKIQLRTTTDQGDIDRKKASDLKVRLKEADIENANLKHELSKVQFELKSKDKVENKLSFSKEETKILKDNNTKLQDEIIRMSKDRAILEEQLNQKDHKIEDLKRQLSKSHDSEKKLEKYIEKNKELKNLRDELREQNESLRLDLKKQEQKIKDLEFSQDGVKTEKQRFNQEKEDYLKKIHNLTLENNDLNSQIEKLKIKQDDLINQLGDTERIKEEYKNKVAALKYEKNRLKEDYHEKENKIKDDYLNEIKRLNVEAERQQETQSKLKIVNDIQSIIRDHRKNRGAQDI